MSFKTSVCFLIFRLLPNSNGTFASLQTPQKHNMASDLEFEKMQSGALPEPKAVQNVTKTINKRIRRKHNKWTLIITFASLVLIIILITIAYLVAKGLLGADVDIYEINEKKCQDELTCSIEIVETVPSVLVYPSKSPKHTETHVAWKNLIQMASSNIHIISFYWTMTNDDVSNSTTFPQAKVGEEILAELLAAASRGKTIRIVFFSRLG